MPRALLTRIALVTSSIAAVLLFAPPAAAKCMMPRPMLAPGFATVPADPVVWLLVPGRTDAKAKPPRVRARAHGKRVDVTVTEDTAHASLRAYRVAIAAKTAGRLIVEVLDAEGKVELSRVLTVDPAWKPPAVAPATMTVTHESDSWTCSYTRTRNLRFDGTASAYRVVVADSEDELEAGKATVVVVPAQSREFFRWNNEAAEPPTTADLALGHVNCFGHTLVWGQTEKVAKVYALWQDGSEQLVTPKPIVLAPP